MTNTLNTSLLSSMIKSKRGNKGLRSVSAEIGELSAATLSRVEQGKVPDVDTFIKLCKWLDVKADSFIISNQAEQNKGISNKEVIIAHLRSETELDPETVNAIVKLVDIAYTKRFRTSD
jgi:transcriptional regulator with XRE-family HTH domain